MRTRHSPTVRLRRLSLELRRLREHAGLTLTDAAKAAGWNQSNLSRAETRQWRQPNPAHLAALLDVYGVTEDAQPQRRAELLQLAREGRRRGWWADYPISDAYGTYVGLEAEAATVRNWEPVVIPGLLQTAAYARALITARAPRLTSDQVDELVALRIERQERLLSSDDPIRLWAIVCETALRTMVGGAAVMAEQLDHLHTIAQLGHVTLQVLSFAAGAAPARGPFAVLTFPHPVDPEAVYVETPAGDLWVEDPAAVAGFLSGWERLIAVSLPAADTITVITARANYLRAKGGTGDGPANGVA
ncbi:helix-turn-helix domain-containing protein [Actinomadura bangladeshensis]|uniref:Helix-turn-helix domain-containing protein n=1 Tax=Actinomadura bangladeshensis TaxID=453573 RepID=A0A6L9QBI7_9ACTN|nr:helix-turn-helix transcriptional regulator [Actinomadura bangladeshensis]NEA22615.1 helix-turn-helix domain-containing protein [Actinomadura bangladeshensis]